MINNIPFSKIKPGDCASFSKTISEGDVYGFAGITGDFNPLHVDRQFAEKSIFKQRVVHGMLSAGLISTVLGTALPGLNTVYLEQNLRFLAPVFIGDTLTARVEVLEKIEQKSILKLKTEVHNQDSKKIIDGAAVVMKK